MGSIVFILLPIGLLVGVALFAAVFFESAFAGPARKGRGGQERRLPLMKGNDLRAWASQEVARIIQRFAKQPMDATGPIAIAREAEELMTKVIVESLGESRGRNDVRCDDRKAEIIGVTAPEALAIVDALRRELPPSALAKARVDAIANAQGLAERGGQHVAHELPACVLLANNGCCLTFDARPIQCRGQCLGTAGSCGDAARENTPFAEAVCQGVRAGLSEQLKGTNRDGNVYELNSAVGRALGIPDAAARWSRGEAVFEWCTQVAS